MFSRPEQCSACSSRLERASSSGAEKQLEVSTLDKLANESGNEARETGTEVTQKQICVVDLAFVFDGAVFAVGQW